MKPITILLQDHWEKQVKTRLHTLRSRRRHTIYPLRSDYEYIFVRSKEKLFLQELIRSKKLNSMLLRHSIQWHQGNVLGELDTGDYGQAKINDTIDKTELMNISTLLDEMQNQIQRNALNQRQLIELILKLERSLKSTEVDSALYDIMLELHEKLRNIKVDYDIYQTSFESSRKNKIIQEIQECKQHLKLYNSLSRIAKRRKLEPIKLSEIEEVDGNDGRPIYEVKL